MQSSADEAQAQALLRKKKRILILCGCFLAVFALAFYVERQDAFFSYETAVAGGVWALLYVLSIADWLTLRGRLNSAGKGGSWTARAIYASYVGIVGWLLAVVVADVYAPGVAGVIRPAALTPGILTGAICYAACHLFAVVSNALVFRT